MFIVLVSGLVGSSHKCHRPESNNSKCSEHGIIHHTASIYPVAASSPYVYLNNVKSQAVFSYNEC